MVELAICAIVRDQASYLHEWLSYHYVAGVRRFVLYDNASRDDMRAIVAGWPRRELVTIVDWPQPDSRLPAYADMVVRLRLVAEWCAFIDCDEFLVPQSSLSVLDVLQAIGREANGLYVHWLMFGSSGHLTRPPGLVTESYRWRAPDGFAAHAFGRSIVRLGALTHVGPHVFRCTGRLVNDAGLEIDQHSTGQQARSSHALLALNRYFTRSRQEWLEDHADAEFAQHDINAVQDDRASLFMQAARAMFYLPRTEPNTVTLPSPAVLLSAHGTLLCWDSVAARVVHCAPEQVGGLRTPLQVQFGLARQPQCRLAQRLEGETEFALSVVGMGPLLTLRGGHGFVSAADGAEPVHARAAEAGQSETFLPLAPEDASRLAALAPDAARTLPGFRMLIYGDLYDLRAAVPRARLAATALPGQLSSSLSQYR